ncbi:MAG: GNAT family N-acetyltransferase [Acidobacteria bacterium]|nr:GNAT family N-acetyltransferase [Acidobacteriota bacterium]
MNDGKLSELTIRMADAADAATIALVLHQSFAEFEALYSPEAFAATISSPGKILDRLSEGPVWVAELDGAIVGTVSAVAKASSLYIRGMAVDPTAQGRKVGYELLRCVEKFARQHKFQGMFLSTTPFLTRAIALYERFGFSRGDEGPDNLFRTPLFTMAKSLI